MNKDSGKLSGLPNLFALYIVYIVSLNVVSGVTVKLD